MIFNLIPFVHVSVYFIIIVVPDLNNILFIFSSMCLHNHNQLYEIIIKFSLDIHIFIMSWGEKNISNKI